jgi:pimeloyl-ACP methyl ester carboxylesterase
VNNLKKWCDGLQREFVMAHGVRTAIFVVDGGRPPDTLLIHGINGSHYGLAELARQLERQGLNPVLVDLPGHGATDNPDWYDLANLHQWFWDLYTLIASRSPSLQVVAHSFGCYAVTPTKSRTIFVCPVPTKSKLAQRAADMVPTLFRPRWTIKVYDWRPFSYWRGIRLLHNKRSANRRRVAFVARCDVATTIEQRRYQAQLAKHLPQQVTFSDVKPDLVVMGRFDHLARERTIQQMAQVFPTAKIVQVPSGHMPNIECVPQLVNFACETL